MSNFQTLSDKTAIGLSVLCALHCLALPLLVVALPTLAVLSTHGETFHLWMLTAVIPVSVYALTMGCRKHGRYGLIIWGGAGITSLIAAILLGHELESEFVETALTLFGATLLAYGHFKNYRQCSAHDKCNHDCGQ